MDRGVSTLGPLMAACKKVVLSIEDSVKQAERKAAEPKAARSVLR